VSVTDGSTYLPSPRDYGQAATTGRGLELVELLADRHGTETGAGNGKTVWFELGTGLPEEPTGRRHQAPHVPRGAVEVRLLGVPVGMARAWRQHADALLRELLLERWDDPSRPAAGLDPADGLAHDAFAHLADALGSLPVRAGPTARADVRLFVHPDETVGFAALTRLLDDAAARSEEGHLLAPTTQPEVRMLRRWFCDEVVGQVTGREPTRWPGLPAELETANVPGPDWDVDHVRRAAVAVVAADDANRIVAASPPALELLGWDESLIGRRIAAIIPPRLREAHVAGFTLHLLTGEGAILGREVRLPALRRDGTEADVVIVVNRESARDGRPVFTATLREA
jgi:PAS domain S-box-containing protein